MTLAQLQRRVDQQAGVAVSQVAIWRWLKRLGLRLEKVNRRPGASTEASFERRREFLLPIATIDLERLLFLDESGITTTHDASLWTCGGPARA